MEIGRLGRFRRYAGCGPRPHAGETDETEADGTPVIRPYQNVHGTVSWEIDVT